MLGNHDSTDEPPDLPPITGNGPKKPKKQLLGDALVEAASTITTQVVRGSEINNLVMLSLFLEAWLKCLLSSALACVLIMRNPLCSHQERSQSCKVKKKLQKLRELQCLRDQNILTEEEFKGFGVGFTPQANSLTGWHNTVLVTYKTLYIPQSWVQCIQSLFVIELNADKRRKKYHHSSLSLDHFNNIMYESI